MRSPSALCAGLEGFRHKINIRALIINKDDFGGRIMDLNPDFGALHIPVIFISSCVARP